MIFRPHAIAYLDILGFSRFVEEAEIDPYKMRCLEFCKTLILKIGIVGFGT
jgi:hypothetical protein